MTTTRESEDKDMRASVETAVIIKLGMDVHAAQITVCRQIGGRLPQPPQKLSWVQLLELVQGHRARGDTVYSCYEAGPCGYGLHRQLLALGVINCVVVPQVWDERHRRVKTDKRDARELCQRLDRYVQGNTEAFGTVWVPKPEQEQRRALCRQRGTLLQERQRCELRGHGLMLAQGVHAPRLWWEEKVWGALVKEVPAWLVPHLQRWRGYAQQLQEQIDQLTPQIESHSAGRRWPAGLGAMSAAILDSEIVDWTRFHNRRQPASYSGLCPGEDSSGRRRQQGSISKYGNPRVRHLLVEAVWRMMRWQPDYPPIRRLRGATSCRAKKRLAVAAARRLIVDLWRLRTDRNTAEQLKLRMKQ